MTRPGLPSSGPAAAETELLAQLGLPISASPEDVDELHQAVSQYLATAPAGIRGWAHAQAAALDQAYLQLTDPVGLQGSALRSPARPPTVVPGGPATPPARRGSVPAAVPPTVAAAAAVEATRVGAGSEAAGAGSEAVAPSDEPDLADLDVLYASVTPSAHRDRLPDARTRAAPAAAAVPIPAPPSRRAAPPPVVAPVAGRQGANPWKRIVIGAVAVIVVAGGVFGVYQLGVGSTSDGPGGNTASGGNTAQATPAAPAVDESKVADLMVKLQANPRDIDTLLALADEYYAGEQFGQAGEFFDKILAIEPEHIQALLARGAVSFNLGELEAAEATWSKVVEIEPNNQEAHYDLGYMYFYRATPDYAAVQREWSKVIELDPTTSLAKNAKTHLDALAAKSMLPASSPAASAGASAAPSTAPSASPVAAGSPNPSGAVVSLSAVNRAFSTSTLTAPADSAFTIRFDNRDAEIPHNVEITDAAGNRVFFGEPITGPATSDYQVRALAAGNYTFKCTIHPNMTGTLKVGP